MLLSCEAALEPMTRNMSPAPSVQHLSSAAPVVRHLLQEHQQSGPRWTALEGLPEENACFRPRRRRRSGQEVEKKEKRGGDDMYQEEVSADCDGGNAGRRGIEHHHGRCRAGLVTAAATVVIFASSASAAVSSASSPTTAIATTSAKEEHVASRAHHVPHSLMSPTSPYARRRSHQRLLPRRAGSTISSTRRSRSMIRVPGFVKSVAGSSCGGSFDWRGRTQPPSPAPDAVTSELWDMRVAVSRRSARASIGGNHRPLPSTPASSSSKGVQMISAAGRGIDGFSGEYLQTPPAWNLDRAGATWKRDAARRRTSIRGEGAMESRPVQRSPPSATTPNNEGNTVERPLDSTMPAASSPRGRPNVVKGGTSWTPKQEGQGSWDKHGTRPAEAGVAVDSDSSVWRVDLNRGVYTVDVKIKQPLGLDLSECKEGVCVSKVRAGSSAEQQGIREGDRIVATSATLGDGLWEKNTVDGILSAVGTRLVLSDTVTLRVERPLNPRQLAAARFQETVTQTFEITLGRPPGLVLEQVWDSSGNGEPEGVVVAGIIPGSPADLSGAVEAGDRVVAISSSLGNNMWPYKRLEGVLSAIELHIGKTVNIRLQRIVEMGSWTDPSSAEEDDATIDSALRVFRERGADINAATASKRYTKPLPATAVTGTSSLQRYRTSPVEAASAAAEAATAAAAAAATSAGFVASGMGIGLRGRGAQAGDAGVKSSDGKDEARTIVLERCAALVKSYGARRQAIAVDSLLERMEQAGVRKNARFLNSVLTAYLQCKEPQKAVDTFHAVTGIIWPELPPWPSSPTARAVTSRARGGKSTRSVPSPVHANPVSNSTSAISLTGTELFSHEEEEELSLLKAGPPSDLKDSFEAFSSWEGTGGERFLLMRDIGEGGDGGSNISSRNGDGEPCACEGVPCDEGIHAEKGGGMRRPVLGEYIGECRPNGFLVATLVKAHGKRGRLDDACRTVLRMPDWGLRPDAAVFNSLAAAAVWNGRLDVAVEVVLGGVMKAWGVRPNQLSYNTVMDAYARAGRVADVLRVFNSMKAGGVSPDVVTTTILVKAQVSKGDVQEAMATLVEMMKISSLRDRLDAFPFNTIIQGLMKTLQWEKAMDLFRSMPYHNVTPDRITFNSLIGGLNKARRPAIAMGLFEEMLDMGIEPDVYTYSSVVNAYAKLGDVEAALRVLSQMAKRGVKPNAFTCASVMQACLKVGQSRTALEVHDQITSKGGVRADAIISSLLVQARAMEGDFNGGFQVLEAMGKLGQDSKIPFNYLIRECVLAGEWEGASEAVKRMLHQGNGGKGIRFDATTFHAVAAIPRGYDGTKSAAWPRLRFLVETKDVVMEKGWPYSSTLYLAILYEYMSREDYAMAAAIVEDRTAGSVFVRASDEEDVANAEEKIRFKMMQRTGKFMY